MQLFELADLAINTQLRLDSSWLLFLTINSTIIGAMILIERKFSPLEKAITSMAYLSVIGLNYMSTTNTLRLLDSIYTDLEKFDFVPADPGFDLINQISDIHSNFLWNQPELMSVFYVGGAILSISAIVFDELLTKTTGA